MRAGDSVQFRGNRVSWPFALPVSDKAGENSSMSPLSCRHCVGGSAGTAKMAVTTTTTLPLIDGNGNITPSAGWRASDLTLR
jgi:hypothetical protein